MHFSCKLYPKAYLCISFAFPVSPRSYENGCRGVVCALKNICTQIYRIADIYITIYNIITVEKMYTAKEAT